MKQEVLLILEQYEENGDFTHANVTSEDIRQAEQMLGVRIPFEYLEFLSNYGHGGIGGIEILGIGKDGSKIFVTETLQYRSYGLPNNLIAIENCDEWLYCLECTSGKVVSWDRKEVVVVYETFEEYLFDRLNDAAENM